MTRHRSIGLRLHLGRHGITYALTARVQSEGRMRDSRLTYGTLARKPTDEGPHDVLALLQAVLWDLCRQHHVDPSALGAPGAPGGGGGRAPVPSPSPDAVAVLQRGQGLDSSAPAD